MNQTPIRTALQLGTAIRRHRKALALTQAQLGERLALRQATISALENGSGDVKLSTLLEALGALGLELTIRPRDAGSASASLEDLF